VIPSQPEADFIEDFWRVALTSEGVIGDSLNKDVVQLGRASIIQEGK